VKKSIYVCVLAGFFLISFCSLVLAETYSDWTESGRYVMKIQVGRAIKNTRIPALVLDTIRGIVWTCQNLQDGQPLWVRADLGQNGDRTLTQKKYVVKMLEWQDADFRMPAIVLDIEGGIVWTCQNIVDGKALWVQRDLKSGALEEISREEIGIVKGVE